MPAHAARTGLAARLPDWARRALRTAAQAFVAVFALALAGWLKDVVTWANCTDACTSFPALTPLGKAAVAAAAGAAAAVVAGLQNLLEDRTSFPALLKAPASSGRNPEPDAGYSAVDAVVLVVLVLLAVFLVLALLGRV